MSSITQSQALEKLRAMMRLIQKARSNAHDPVFGLIDENPDSVALPITKELLADLFPWIYGEKCPLPALDKMLSRANETGYLAPADFFNMMTILYRFTPELVAVAPIALGKSGIITAEQPDYTQYLRGWKDG